MIRAVTFDFWGTLYDGVGPAEARRKSLRAEYAGGFFMGIGADVTPEQLGIGLDVVNREVTHLREVDQASMAAEEAGQRLARAVGVRLELPEALRLGELVSAATREEPPELLEGARDVLAALQGSVKLGLICDTGLTMGQDLYAVMEADALAGMFQCFTFSNQTGTTKPMVRQFHHTLHRLGCLPAEGVHVGDLESTDIAGARQAGMRSVRIIHGDEDRATAADAAVGAISEVPDVLRRWGLDI